MKPITLELDTTEVINVLLIGAGGNGSEMFDALIKIHNGLTAFDLPGLQVVVMDDDVVAEHNLVRQRFWPHELGFHKAIALVHRTNLCLGTAWQGLPIRYSDNSTPLLAWSDIVITAVDTLAARACVHASQASLKASRNQYWLDLGVDRTEGQVVFGGLRDSTPNSPLPNVIALYPNILTDTETHSTPSCSAPESLARQDLFVNSTAANIAAQMLWRALRTGNINQHFSAFNLAEGWHKTIPPQAIA